MKATFRVRERIAYVPREYPNGTPTEFLPDLGLILTDLDINAAEKLARKGFTVFVCELLVVKVLSNSILSAEAGGGIIAMNGTSMATPHATGIAALWAESNPALRGSALLNALTAAATPLAAPPADVGTGTDRHRPEHPAPRCLKAPEVG